MEGHVKQPAETNIGAPQTNGTVATIMQANSETATAGPLLAELAIGNSDVEEGEVDEAEEALEQVLVPRERTLAFEIKFANKGIFHQYGNDILSALDETLNKEPQSVDQEKAEFEFTINETADDSASGQSSEGGMVSVSAFLTVVQLDDPVEMSVDSGVAKSVDSVGVMAPPTAPEEKESSPDLDLGSLFTIDTAGTSKLDTVQVPSYKRAIKDVLDEESAERKRQKQEIVECPRPRAVGVCFNCGSSKHGLRNCSKPRNSSRINRAKKAFSSKHDRYHVDVEQRFAHLRPGVISDKLQAALGLRRGELPFFFYRMRALGYPPGWLEDAKVASSGMALFNSDGNAVEESDDVITEYGMDHKYNVSKIVDFPGFNVDPGPKFFDDYQHHDVPPINRRQMKDEFIKTLGDNVIKGYKRKKLKDLPPTASVAACDSSATSLEVADMDIEDADIISETNVIFTRPLPPPEPGNIGEQPPPPPPPDSPPVNNSACTDTSCNSSSEERSQSPSLADLEAQQQQLLTELQTSNLHVVTEPDDSLIDEVLELDDTQSSMNASSDQVLDNTPAAASPLPTTPLSTPSTPQPNEPKRSDVIKESHMGTPLLKFSPFDQLPAGENFKVGVSDVINFENLPDSTGKYEQMKVVIKKVRNIITRLHDDDDD